MRDMTAKPVLGHQTLQDCAFEAELDNALVSSADLLPCPEYVRTLLEVLQQQPFLPAYAVCDSPMALEVQEQLLELPCAQQSRVLDKIFQVSSK